MNIQLIKKQLKYLAKNIYLGVIFYRLYSAPKNLLLQLYRKGLINIATNFQAQKQMEKAAYRLQPIYIEKQISPLEIHFLSGKKFWYQTCFCAYSMAQFTDIPLLPVIYDDGSLERKYRDEIQRIFPYAKIISKQEIQERLDKCLPPSKFPYLRERRENYPNMRKLTDIHAGSQGWKLVLDSDMLFFRRPEFLLNWLKSPQRPCHMVDVETSYGYSDTIMTSLTEAEISERLNVGICGLKSDGIDWEQLEYWCKTLIEQQGTHYYQEQALVAMLMAGKTCAVAPVEDYIVMPSREQVINPQAVLHHYVADSKPWYFRYAWKHILHSAYQTTNAMRLGS